MQQNELVWVIMPVYNEEESLAHVLDEWLPVFRKNLNNFVFCVLNDGSKDKSLEIANQYAAQNPEIKVVDKPNSGHGQSCIFGYKLAIENNADWVFQMDSDGQCNPNYFADLVKQSSQNQVVYGYRKTRDDGMKRFYISRIVSIFIWFATRVWVKDANVPYRFMHISTLKKVVDHVPKDFHLANILISTYQKNTFGIKWVNIHFNDRFGGEPSVKLSLFAHHGLVMFRQLKAAYKAVKALQKYK
ncbi:MAG: glycosyltransferase family 2 protein [Flavobacteriales bacterium]|nr:glycosyltransferase family 2 protein [Flavobacteriales bacterium]